MGRQEHAVDLPRLTSPVHVCPEASHQKSSRTAITIEAVVGRRDGMANRRLADRDRAPWLSTGLAWLGSVVLSVFLVSHAIRDAWIENRLQSAGLPAPGTYLPTVGTLETATWGLDEYRQALQDVLRRRPNWSEGYLRLGLVHLGMYRQMTKEWLEDSGVGPDDINRMAEPLWLLGTVHEHPEQATAPLGKLDVLSVEPVVEPSGTGGALLSRGPTLFAFPGPSSRRAGRSRLLAGGRGFGIDLCDSCLDPVRK